MGDQVYRVRINYTEPSFARRLGDESRVFSWTYRIQASSQTHAEDYAQTLFHRRATQSSVGWIREIVGLDTEHVGPAELGA